MKSKILKGMYFLQTKFCRFVGFILKHDKNVRFFKKHHKNVQTVAVGDNYNDIDMLKISDIPCLVFNDKFTLDEIPINNLITTNKPSPEGWADVIKMALVKI